MDRNIKKIHFLGIGGISQSALAFILKNKGYDVSGSDKAESEITNQLKQNNIDVCINGVSKCIENTDLVVVSAAISENDAELLYAKGLGKKIISRAQMLGLLAKEYNRVISVAGSHGKTTTTGMIAEIFEMAGLLPTVHIGGKMVSTDSNYVLGGDEFFITEACEYVDSFLELKSDVSVILNIQKDHMDYFKTFSNLKKSFKQFASNTKKDGLIVFSGDDKNFKLSNKHCNVDFSCCGKGVINAKNIKEYEKGKYSFDCCLFGVRLFRVKLGVFGKHNINNALASILVALWFNINKETIKKALFEYKGVKRRFEDYGSVDGVRVIHDYAHHPTEIKATIDLAMRICKGNLYVVFQPHTYSRTKELLKEFKRCFSGSKEILCYKVYPARETKSEGVDEKELARQLSLSGEKAFSFDSYFELKSYLVDKTNCGDMILVLGAGDIESFCDYYKK